MATHEPAFPHNRQQALFDHVVNLPLVPVDDFTDLRRPQTIGLEEPSALFSLFPI
jgi:hypothetical protein